MRDTVCYEQIDAQLASRNRLLELPEGVVDLVNHIAVNPLVWVFLFVSAGNAMFMAYQNMWASMSRGIAGERGWTASHLSRYGVAYFIAYLAATTVAVPIFNAAGLFN